MADNSLGSDFSKLSYALGMSIAGSLIKSGITKVDTTLFIQGMDDTLNGLKPKLDTGEANRILEKFFSEKSGNEAQKNLEKGKAFLTENRRKEEVTVLKSGLQYQVLHNGEGEKATLKDTVRCHYHGTLVDGYVFDSSVERGQPAEFPVNGVIPGWTEALQLMPMGSKWRLFIPPELAYGERGAGKTIGPNSTLIFDVELLEIV